jgi:hypothetical protein
LACLHCAVEGPQLHQPCHWSGPIAPLRLVKPEPVSGEPDAPPGLVGAPLGGCGGTMSTPPSRHAFGSAKTTLQPEHWYSPVARRLPWLSRSTTRR